MLNEQLLSRSSSWADNFASDLSLNQEREQTLSHQGVFGFQPDTAADGRNSNWSSQHIFSSPFRTEKNNTFTDAGARQANKDARIDFLPELIISENSIGLKSLLDILNSAQRKKNPTEIPEHDAKLPQPQKSKDYTSPGNDSGLEKLPEQKPNSDAARRYTGVNLSGAEFGANNLPGKLGSDYIFPTRQELDYYKQKGIDLVRIPFRWERMQPGLLKKSTSNDQTVDRSFAPEYQEQMENFLAAADQKGMKVVLDAQQFGRYNNQIIGASKITNDDFSQFWGQMARTFGQHSSIYGYDLSNEPNDMENKTWQAAAQAAVDGIRATGDKQAIIVEGNQWAGTQSWTQYNNDFSVKDPVNNIIYSAHSYWDSDHSGTYAGGAQSSYDNAVTKAREQGFLGPDEDPNNLGVNKARPFIDWLKRNNYRGFIGEYGVPSNDPKWVNVQDKFLDYARANKIDTAIWGGGPWWGNDYILAQETGPKGAESVNGPVPLSLQSASRFAQSAKAQKQAG